MNNVLNNVVVKLGPEEAFGVLTSVDAQELPVILAIGKLDRHSIQLDIYQDGNEIGMCVSLDVDGTWRMYAPVITGPIK
jgi:hypothetical protein